MVGPSRRGGTKVLGLSSQRESMLVEVRGKVVRMTSLPRMTAPPNHKPQVKILVGNISPLTKYCANNKPFQNNLPPNKLNPKNNLRPETFCPENRGFQSLKSDWLQNVEYSKPVSGLGRGGTVPFCRRRFGVKILAPTFWRRDVLAPTFWLQHVLAPIRFGANTN